MSATVITAYETGRAWVGPPTGFGRGFSCGSREDVSEIARGQNVSRGAGRKIPGARSNAALTVTPHDAVTAARSEPLDPYAAADAMASAERRHELEQRRAEGDDDEREGWRRRAR